MIAPIYSTIVHCNKFSKIYQLFCSSSVRETASFAGSYNGGKGWTLGSLGSHYIFQGCCHIIFTNTWPDVGKDISKGFIPYGHSLANAGQLLSRLYLAQRIQTYRGSKIRVMQKLGNFAMPIKAQITALKTNLLQPFFIYQLTYPPE